MDCWKSKPFYILLDFLSSFSDSEIKKRRPCVVYKVFFMCFYDVVWRDQNANQFCLFWRKLRWLVLPFDTWVIPTRCRDLHPKQLCLEDIVPAVLIILITHIIIAVRWMLIKILSAVINHQGRVNKVVSGGCHPNNNIIRKIGWKIKMGAFSFCDPILYSVYRHARYCGYYN